MRQLLSLFLLLVAACGDGSGTSFLSLPASDDALCVALGADYRNNVGTMAVVGLPSLTVLKDVIPGAVSGDPVLRAYGRKLYIVNRTAANVTVIDTSSWTVEMQFSTGANSNPQDIALAGDKAYVPLYGKGDLQVWDLGQKAPAAPAKNIDLAYLDEDGVPQANSVVIVRDVAFVTVNLLDTQMYPQPRGKGKVVLIDVKDDTPAQAVELNYTNPYDFMFRRSDRLLVATFADFLGSDGCLEQIALEAPPRTVDCLVKNSEAGGVINSIAVADDELFLAVSAFDADFNQTAAIRRVGTDNKLVTAAMTPNDQIPTDLAWSPSGHLVYSDGKAGGLRVIDLAAGREITTAPLDIGLTPATANAIVCMAR